LCSFFFSKKITSQEFTACLLKIVLPLVLLWGVHLLSFYLLHDTWQAHYKLDIQNSFTASNIFWKINRYTSSILLLDFLWTDELRKGWYAFLKAKPTLWITGLLVSFLFVWGWIRYAGMKGSQQALYSVFVCFLFSLSLIIPM